MADLLDSASAWLDGMRARHMTRPVTYQRGESAVELAATVGRTLFETANEFGIVERTESRDFLIAAADLVLDGQSAQPRRGDRIREPSGGQVFVYEVMAPGNEPCWRFSDPYRRTLRIHTKQVAVE